MNYGIQNYRGLNLMLRDRSDYSSKRAKEYIIISPAGFETEHKVWIPNSCQIGTDGTLNSKKNFMYVFNNKVIEDQLFDAGYEFTY